MTFNKNVLCFPFILRIFSVLYRLPFLIIVSSKGNHFRQSPIKINLHYHQPRKDMSKFLKAERVFWTPLTAAIPCTDAWRTTTTSYRRFNPTLCHRKCENGSPPPSPGNWLRLGGSRTKSPSSGPLHTPSEPESSWIGSTGGCPTRLSCSSHLMSSGSSK